MKSKPKNSLKKAVAKHLMKDIGESKKSIKEDKSLMKKAKK